MIRDLVKIEAKEAEVKEELPVAPVGVVKEVEDVAIAMTIKVTEGYLMMMLTILKKNQTLMLHPMKRAQEVGDYEVAVGVKEEVAEAVKVEAAATKEEVTIIKKIKHLRNTAFEYFKI